MNVIELNQKDKERFLTKIKKTDSCWLWTAGLNYFGYGKFSLCHNGKESSVIAHRISWIIRYGYIPDDKWVLHKCDNPSCVNPEHLYLGLPQDNSNDMVRGNRQNSPKGEQKTLSHILTEKEVLEARSKYVPGVYGSQRLANEYGVSQSEMLRILKHQRWTHI